LCDNNYCNPATGLCVSNVTTCASTSCQTGFCLSATGTCSYVDVQCPNNSTCCGDLQKCNPLTGGCICVNTSTCATACNCLNTLCVSQICTDPVAGTCSSNNSKDCSTVVPNFCFTAGVCTEVGGCEIFPVNCTGTLNPTKCETVVEDPNVVGCCKKVTKTCPTDDCFAYTCNPLTGNCDSTPKCVQTNNLCVVTSCENGVGCVNTTTDCSGSASPCVNSVCNPVTGACDITSVVCADSNACTTDYCDDTIGCVYEAQVCAASTDLCVTALPCNTTTGLCGTVPNICDDGIDCTDDVCDAVTGCSSTPNDVLCFTSDPCINTSKCVVFNSTYGACVTTPTVCPKQGLYCQTALCIAFEGCSATPRDCQGNASNTSCDTYNCSEVNKSCVKKTADCFVFIGLIAGLVVGGIIGGVLGAAAIIFCASTGGAAYAVSESRSNTEGHLVRHNPLFKEAVKGNEVNLGS